jgi:hypothetical protein
MRTMLGAIALFGLTLWGVAADADVAQLAKAKRWNELASLFTDNSGRQLAERFGSVRALELFPAAGGRFTYYAKFPEQGEIGTLTMSRDGNRLSNLNISVMVANMNYTTGYVRYPVELVRLQLGDAELELRSGALYQPVPQRDVFLFSGSWRLQLHPGDVEEQNSLKKAVHRDSFVSQGQTILLALSETEFLKELPSPESTDLPDSPDGRFLIDLFRQEFGCRVPGFDEYWYYPIYRELNLAFFRQDRRSHFKFIFNRNVSPDTSLILLPANRFLLHYNSVQRPKMFLQSPEELERLVANIYYNPGDGLLSATAQIRFREEGGIKTLALAPGLGVREIRDVDGHPLPFLNNERALYLGGPGNRRANIYYAGVFDSNEKNADGPDINPNRVDTLHVLTRDASFYPSPGLTFFPNRLTISLPEAYSCLAPGRLVSSQRYGGRAVFRFESPGSKGLDVVCGSFREVGKVDGLLPIRIHSTAGRFFEKYVSTDKLRSYTDFMISRFGPLPVGEMNILFRRWIDFGGQSYEGFVVFNLAENRINWTETTARRVARDSPVVLTDPITDSMIHELAHQWWGGMVSWRTYRDVWVTEGLAQFSVLAYWQETLPADRFREILDRARRWVVRYGDAGPIVYGQRIANLTGSYDAYQSVVYTKSALVLQMLREIVGGEELFGKLRRGLDEFRFQSVSGFQFGRLLAEGEKQELLERFLRGWLQTRALPRVTWRVQENGKGAELRVSQLDTDLVFPLELQIETPSGRVTRTFVVEGREQVVALPEWQPGQLLQVQAVAAPLLSLERERSGSAGFFSQAMKRPRISFSSSRRATGTAMRRPRRSSRLFSSRNASGSGKVSA